jgi:VWFA-related protein
MPHYNSVPRKIHGVPSALRRVGLFAAILASVAVLASAALRAQSTPKPQPAPPTQQPPPASPESKIAVQVKLVAVYATVRDKHGKIVPSLTKDDFVIDEDGHPQTITHFVAESDLPLTLGLLVDTSLSQREVLDDERKASYTFLDHMLRDRDKAFLIHFDREVELLQDLTSSRPKLQAALQLLQTPELNRDTDNGGDGGSGGQGRRYGGGGGTQLYDAVYLASSELMKKQQGRKALFILSDGVDRGSKESLPDAIEAAQRADTSVYSIFFEGQESEDRGLGHHGGWGGRGPGGVGWPGGGGAGGGGGGRRYPQEQRPDGKKVLEQISTATGGHMFQVSKKLPLDQIYAQVEEELRNQYALGYTPNPPDTEGGYHKIHLTTKQKDMNVQARDGYYSGQ